MQTQILSEVLGLMFFVGGRVQFLCGDMKAERSSASALRLRLCKCGFMPAAVYAVRKSLMPSAVNILSATCGFQEPEKTYGLQMQISAASAQIHVTSSRPEQVAQG